MFKVWTASERDPEMLAKDLEAHLNEYAEEVICVSYSVARNHHALAVYKPVDHESPLGENAVSVAEAIIDQAQA